MKGTSKHSLACANFFIPSLLNKNVRHGQFSVVVFFNWIFSSPQFVSASILINSSNI